MSRKSIDFRSSRIPSTKSKIHLLSLLLGCVVFAIALVLQWLVYDDWMHWGGPLRIVGSTLAGVLTFVLSSHWQFDRRRQRVDMLRRFETIASMTDRIRNALQAIQFVDYATSSHATDSVRNSVGVIDNVLREMLCTAHPVLRIRTLDEAETAPSHPALQSFLRSGSVFSVSSRPSE